MRSLSSPIRKALMSPLFGLPVLFLLDGAIAVVILSDTGYYAHYPAWIWLLLSAIAIAIALSCFLFLRRGYQSKFAIYVLHAVLQLAVLAGGALLIGVILGFHGW